MLRASPRLRPRAEPPRLLSMAVRGLANPNRPRQPRSHRSDEPAAKKKVGPAPVHKWHTPPAFARRIIRDEKHTTEIVRSAAIIGQAVADASVNRRFIGDAQREALEIKPKPLELPAKMQPQKKSHRPIVLKHLLSHADPGALMLQSNDLPAQIKAASDVEHALALVQHFVDAGGRPDTTLATALVRTCMEAKQYVRAWELYQNLDTSHGVLWDVNGYIAGIELCGKVRRAPRALQLFEMCERTLGRDAVAGVLHPTMATLSKDIGTAPYALNLYQRMVKELQLIPSPTTLCIVLDACARLGDVNSARFHWDEMVASGDVTPDGHCYTSMLNCYARGNWKAMRKSKGSPFLSVAPLSANSAPLEGPLIPGEVDDEVSEAFRRLKERGGEFAVLETKYDDDVDGEKEGEEVEDQELDDDLEDAAEDAALGSAAMIPVSSPKTLAEKQRQVNENIAAALALVKEMEFKDVGIANPTYNALCKVFAKAMRLNRAEQVLERFKEAGLKPDAHTYGTLIQMYARAQRVDKFLGLESKAREAGVDLYVQTEGAMIDALARCQHVDDAVARLEQLKNKGVKLLEKHIRFLRVRLDGERLDLVGPDPNYYRSPKVVGRLIRTVDANPELKKIENKIKSMSMVGKE